MSQVRALNTRLPTLRNLLALLALAAVASTAAARGAYATDGECDGFPRVSLVTPVGLCVGLVAAGLGFPRGVAVIDNDIYVVDMGGWEPGRGRLLRLRERGHAVPEVILQGLDRPNGLLATAEGRLLIGVLGRIQSLLPDAPGLPAEDVVTGLPLDGRHPLTAFARAADGTLFVNIGSHSDHCEGADGSPPSRAAACPERQEAPPRGAILRIPAGAFPADARSAEVHAAGLRNAMALTVLRSGQLLAATNARDAIGAADPTLADARLPHELLLRVQRGADYGWPYCYDRQRPSPEYPQFDCRTATLPDLLLPAHAAPLGLLEYQGQALPPLAGKILIAYHGYRANGHRLVAITVRGDLPLHKPTTIIDGWDYAKGRRARGAPVALAQMPDGSVLISEDRNGTLLRLAKAAP